MYLLLSTCVDISTLWPTPVQLDGPTSGDRCLPEGRTTRDKGHYQGGEFWQRPEGLYRWRFVYRSSLIHHKRLIVIMFVTTSNKPLIDTESHVKNMIFINYKNKSL